MKNNLSLYDISEISDPVEGYEELDGWINTYSFDGKLFDLNPLAIKEFLAIWCMKGDTLNGGFHQYFFNSWGDSAPFALSGLKKTGAEKVATLLEAAMELFGSGGYPGERFERQDILLDFDKNKEKILDELTDDFYGIDENYIEILNFEYFRKNVELYNIDIIRKNFKSNFHLNIDENKIVSLTQMKYDELFSNNIPQDIIEKLNPLVDQEYKIKDFYDILEVMLGDDIILYYPNIIQIVKKTK